MKTDGFLMIEILIAMMLISFALLALLQYQIASLNNTEKTNTQSIIQQQLFNFSEMLLMTENSEQQTLFLTRWNQENKTLLVKNIGTLEAINNHICRITLSSQSQIVLC